MSSKIWSATLPHEQQKARSGVQIQVFIPPLWVQNREVAGERWRAATPPPHSSEEGLDVFYRRNLQERSMVTLFVAIRVGITTVLPTVRDGSWRGLPFPVSPQRNASSVLHRLSLAGAFNIHSKIPAAQAAWTVMHASTWVSVGGWIFERLSASLSFSLRSQVTMRRRSSTA